MDETTVFEAEWLTCPGHECSRRFGSVNGVVMHAVNKEDAKHADFDHREEAIMSIIEMYRSNDA